MTRVIICIYTYIHIYTYIYYMQWIPIDCLGPLSAAWQETPPPNPGSPESRKIRHQSINQSFPFLGSVTLLGLNARLATEYILYWLPVSILEFFYIYIYISIISSYDCIRGAYTKEDRLTHAHHAVNNNKQNTQDYRSFSLPCPRPS